MTQQRVLDKQPGTHFRSDRVSAVNGRFYFATREGTLEGPYFTRADAERQIGLYIHRMQQALAIRESRP